MSDSRELIPGDDHHIWEAVDDPGHDETISVHPPTSYRHAFGDKPIRLGVVEFHILLFLAQRPYHAFTRRQIADALSTGTPTALYVEESTIDAHVATLRNQLGVLGDFVQTVPYVGYRYKA
jgi:DNA-binding response OmpR family regulator